MSKELAEELKEEIAKKQVVVIVGAGVSISASRNASRKPNVASWTGLLESGVTECTKVVPNLPERWDERVRLDITSSDIDDLLSAATKIERKLGGRTSGDFARWLQRTVGALPVHYPEVPEALKDLGLPLLTTNYDGILEQVTGRPALTWRDGASIERVLRGEDECIVHLHGYFRQPETVILGIRSYEQLLRDEHAQSMQQALMALRTLLFVGFGAGLEDPNFGTWLEWRRRALASSPYPSYRLACGSKEAELFQRQHKPEDRIRIISYSERGEFNDLAPFLRSLTPENKSRGSVNPNTIGKGSRGPGPKPEAGRQQPPHLTNHVAIPPHDTKQKAQGFSKPPFRPLEQVIQNTVLRVEYRSITSLEADVLVSSDDTELSMSGGVSAALLKAGGRSILHSATAQAPIRLGDIVVTNAGKLKARKVFHAAVLDYSHPHLTHVALIRQVTRKCLKQCEELGFQSIGFPALATGAAGLSPERSAVAMLLEIARYLEGTTRLNAVTIVLYPRGYLSQDVLPRFYSQVENFLELTRRLEGTTAALGKIEQAYREHGSIEATRIAESRANLSIHRDRWEKIISTLEPIAPNQGTDWLEPLEAVEIDLKGLPSLAEPPREVEPDERASLPSGRLSSQEIPKRSWLRIEREYKEERRGALRALIAIHEKRLTELEIQLAMSGSSAELERQLNWVQRRLEQLRNDLDKLDAELSRESSP